MRLCYFSPFQKLAESPKTQVLRVLVKRYDFKESNGDSYTLILTRRELIVKNINLGDN